MNDRVKRAMKLERILQCFNVVDTHFEFRTLKEYNHTQTHTALTMRKASNNETITMMKSETSEKLIRFNY